MLWSEQELEWKTHIVTCNHTKVVVSVTIHGIVHSSRVRTSAVVSRNR